MQIKYYPALIVPVVMVYCTIVLGLIYWRVSTIANVETHASTCSYYVNRVNYTGQDRSTFAGFSYSSYNMAVVDFLQDSTMVADGFGSTGCTEEMCPDSIEVTLWKLCAKEESDFDIQPLRTVIFK